MKKTKEGISLIVLVITVIIMIILASAIIINLSNSDIIERANEAVEKTDLQEIQNIASIAWSEAYFDGKTSKTELQKAVEDALKKNKVDKDNYIVDVTTKGVKIELQTLGGYIKNSADYGKTVDYTVTVDGETYNEWQVFYEDTANGYVFLITTNAVEFGDVYSLKAFETINSVTDEHRKLYDIFNLGDGKFKSALDINFGDYGWNLVVNGAAYANTTLYGENVIGAMCGPTLEMLAAGYNLKHGDIIIKPVVNLSYVEADPNGTENGWNKVDGKEGYFINSVGQTRLDYLIVDDIYTFSSGNYLLVSPSAALVSGEGCCLLIAGTYLHGNSKLSGIEPTYTPDVYHNIRPVVCLKSSTPAVKGTTTDISLVIQED